MKPLAISGIGILSACGRGLEKFERALKSGWVPPAVSKEGRHAYRISPEDLADREVLDKVRRGDRFSKMVVFAAHDALKDSGSCTEEARQSTGVIVATAFGAHSSIFKFLDGILDYGETQVSPTTFAHSIHNAAAAYVASALNCRGPVLTLTQFHFSFHQALLLAYAWLAEGRVQRVLVGVADECSPAMEYICEEKLAGAAGGKMNPLSFSARPGLVPGEGSVFFLLTLDPAAAKYGFFADIRTGSEARAWEDADLSIFSGNALSGSEKVYRNVLKEGASGVAYSPLYGGLMSSGAFESAAAALMLKNQMKYASPVFDKISDFETVEETTEGAMESIQCVSHSCEGELAYS